MDDFRGRPLPRFTVAAGDVASAAGKGLFNAAAKSAALLAAAPCCSTQKPPMSGN